MKNSIVMLLFLLEILPVSAQKLPLPADAGKLPLPDTRKLKPLQPPDLQVTALELQSFLYHTQTDYRGGRSPGEYYVVAFSVTIKNSGGSIASKNTLAIEFQPLYERATRYWLSDRPEIEGIKPGQHITKVITSYISVGLFDESRCSLRVQADAFLRVTESNEDNNYSPVIILDPSSVKR